MRTIISTTAVLALLFSAAPAVSAYNTHRNVNTVHPYEYPQRSYDDQGKITVYGSYDRISRFARDDLAIYASPFRTQTHALHPYYRNSYYQRQGLRYPVLNSDEFNNYLRELYYYGDLSTASLKVPTTPNTRCYNYTVTRANQWVPPVYTGCY